MKASFSSSPVKPSTSSNPSTPSTPFTPSTPSSPKLLIITYYWPPGSGAGVQRWLKFSKYLPSYGWEPIILTVDPGYAAYPAIDKSLENDIPSDLRVYKTKAIDYYRLYKKNKSAIPSAGFAVNNDKSFTGKISRFIRGNFFIPDPRKGWNRYAFRKACEIIENEKIVNIITTSPPHSTQLTGLRLKKKYPHINWIADLRDPWTEIYYYEQFYPTIISKWTDLQYEKKVLRNADRIITVGYSLKDMFATRETGIEKKTDIIFNGYDEDDFKGIGSAKPEQFTISYIGTLSPSYPVGGILRSLSGLAGEGKDFLLRFVGMVSKDQKDLILARIGESRTEFIGYADHSRAIGYMLNSSALLLIIPDHISNKCIITGKLFEYLASKVPIICLGPPDGDAGRILEDCGNGKVFRYEDSDGLSDYLKLLHSGTSPEILKSPEMFRRDRLTQRIASLLKA